MRNVKIKRIAVILLAACCLLLCGCSRLARITLPPLPTPVVETPTPSPTATPEPTPVPTPVPTPEPTPEPEPEPTPVPTPEPEDVNTPHLSIENETLPQDMTQSGIQDLLGEISFVLASSRGEEKDSVVRVFRELVKLVRRHHGGDFMV